MVFKTTIVQLLVALLALCANGTSRDLMTLCDNVQCSEGHYCRIVVQSCDEPMRFCRPSALCLPCVPENVDDNCNHEGYLYSVIFYDPNISSLQKPFPCDNDGSCPIGSTCVHHGHSAGVCCYGGPYKSRVFNSDRHCVRCWPECDEESHCVKEDTICSGGRDVCRTNRPDIKPGFCFTPPTECNPDELGYRLCEGDLDCPDATKCCDSRCNGTACVAAMMP